MTQESLTQRDFNIQALASLLHNLNKLMSDVTVSRDSCSAIGLHTFNSVLVFLCNVCPTPQSL